LAPGGVAYMFAPMTLRSDSGYYRFMGARISSGSSPLAIAVLTALLGASAGAAAPPTTNSTPSTPAPPASAAQSNEAASYSLGLQFATQWREGGLDGRVSEDDLIRGIRAGLAGTALSAEDRQRANTLMNDAYEGWGERNKAAAAEFLARNAKQADVKTTASGLQYLVLTAGDPKTPPPGPGDHVTVQYRGRLLNGTEFDSTYGRGKPGVIRPSDAMSGWREALEMMSPGAKWRIFVPPDLAYALRPPPAIPPNSLLIFDIEVLGINQPGEARAQAPAAH
jgi:FKBP-type peptidyl-prolyl cis-trans isomerase FklB